MNSDFVVALEALPHGPEFRFLDAVTSLKGGASGCAVYRVRGDEPFLAGHFPGRPMLPGVILIEAVAQLAGVVAQTDPSIPPLRDLRLASVRSAKISGTVGPGTLIEIEAELEGRLGGVVQASGRISHAGRELLRAQVTLSGLD
ncbi:MAG: 3-hydroxyacyl-ACP dehydratase FabZ family protein [Verrucomicrobiales bacterium]